MFKTLWARFRAWLEDIREPFDVEDIYDGEGPWWTPPGNQP